MKLFSHRGFTLVELLVVISIIALLSSIATASLNGARKKSRIAKRLADMKTVQTAIELYYDANGSYPNPSGTWTGNPWRSECNAWGTFASGDVIPGIVPTYLTTFPSDPKMDKPASTSCYIYRSNGADYKFLDHSISEFSSADYFSQPALVDTNRDGGANLTIIDGTAPWAWSLYTPNAIGW